MADLTPRTFLEIPKHQARSKALITIYGTYGGYDPSGQFPDLSSLVLIGNVTSVDVPVNRGSSERRELRADTLGAILEQVPGLVDYEGFTLNHVVTYKATFLEACGFLGHSLEYEAYPMLFMLVLPSPNLSQYPEKRLIIEKAWIKANPLLFSVEDKDDLKITQAVTLAVSRIWEVR